MSLYPKAAVKLLPQNGRQPLLTPTTAILHTNGSKAKSLFAYFASKAAGGVESHFQVLADGVVEQYIDTGHTADANYHANPFAISIETEDGGDPNTPWTPAQIASILDLLRWLHAEHGISLEVCTHAGGGGVGWHSMWGYRDPVNLTGPVTNPWSPSFSKPCPGRVRIAQILDTIIPSLNGDTDMLDSPTLTNAAFVDDCYARILKQPADATGRAFWIGKLDRNEMTRNDLRFEFQIVRDAARDAMVGGGGTNPAVVQAAVEQATRKFYADLAAWAAARPA